MTNHYPKSVPSTVCLHPTVWPNGDCIRCGVLATVFPGKSQRHVMVPRELPSVLLALRDRARAAFQIGNDISDQANDLLESIGCGDGQEARR